MVERKHQQLTSEPACVSAEVRNEADAIDREMEHTRRSMDRTFEELQRRLSPSHIAHQTLDQMKEASNNMYRKSIDTIKDHPIPAAIAGFSIALFVGSVIFDRARHRRSVEWNDDRAQGLDGDACQTEHHVTDMARDMAGTATRAVTNAAHSARESISKAASSVAERTRDVAHNLNETRQSVQRQVRQGYVATRDSVEHSFHDHPLLIGAGVFSAGLALGAVLPSTQREDRLLGEYRDELIDGAKARVTRAARHAASAASDAARRESLDDPANLISDVRNRTGPNATAKDVAEEVGRRAGAVVGETVKAVKDEVQPRSGSKSSNV